MTETPESALRALAQAQTEMEAAEVERAAAKLRYNAALERRKTAFASRVAALHAALDSGVSHKEAAKAMGISVPRVYQLQRDYPSQQSSQEDRT